MGKAKGRLEIRSGSHDRKQRFARFFVSDCYRSSSRRAGFDRRSASLALRYHAISKCSNNANELAVDDTQVI